jgi:hypothetical protein
MTCTWPNIVFVVISVFQHLNKIRPLHWSIIKGLLCYLKGTQNMAFSTPKTKKQNLTVIDYSNVDCVSIWMRESQLLDMHLL